MFVSDSDCTRDFYAPFSRMSANFSWGRIQKLISLRRDVTLLVRAHSPSFNYHVLDLVRVLLGLLVLDPAVLNLLRELRDREPGVDPAGVLEQRLVHETVLVLGVRTKCFKV